MTRRVLFICTGNSARSQMAEALVNHDLAPAWQAASAGTVPAGYVHPLAIRVLAELGIDAAGLRSKSVEEMRDASFDVVVTVCDRAAETCPLWLGKGRVVHMGFPDPAAVTGSEGERLAVFRRLRDDIRQAVCAYLARI